MIGLLEETAVMAESQLFHDLSRISEEDENRLIQISTLAMDNKDLEQNLASQKEIIL